MVRVTLDDDYGSRIKMCFGYDVAVPMQFGGAEPALTVDFRGAREALPAVQTIYWLDWAIEDDRSTIMPEAAAAYYFGDPRSGGMDNALVKARRVPNLNDERQRVALTWGDYLFSERHGKYSTVKIDLPRIPHVTIYPMKQNGMTNLEAPIFKPWEFFKWEDQLDSNWQAELANYKATRNVAIPAAPVLSLSDMSEDELDKLAAMLAKRKSAARAS